MAGSARSDRSTVATTQMFEGDHIMKKRFSRWSRFVTGGVAALAVAGALTKTNRKD
jgi:hypothetical protein